MALLPIQGARLTGENWRDNYQTPPHILKLVDEFYKGQWIDPCPKNPRLDGLKIKWGPKSYINPPFSKYLDWVKAGVKQFDESLDLKNIEQLWIMNHDSTTQRMALLMNLGSSMCLLDQRVQWIDPRTGKPTMVVSKKTGKESKGTDPCKSQTLIYIGPNKINFRKVFSQLGVVIDF